MPEEPPPIPAAQKHSGLGIASFAISILAGLGMFVVFAIAGIMESSTPGGFDQKSMPAILIGFGIMGLMAIDLVATGLGVAGFMQTGRKKVFAILGTIFSFVAVICTIGLILIGIMMKQD